MQPPVANMQLSDIYSWPMYYIYFKMLVAQARIYRIGVFKVLQEFANDF